MFRKLRSNRDPQDTILSELKKELKPYFDCCRNEVKATIQKKPATTFAVMVVLIILSAGLSFTIFRNSQPAEQGVRTSKVNAVPDGFDQILSVSASIKQGLSLKHQIDSLSTKKTLTKIDSEVLVKDLDKLRQLNKPFHP